MLNKEKQLDIAQQVKQACIDAARDGFRDASIRGLCNEGAVEAAVSAIQNLRLNKILEKTDSKEVTN